MVSSDQLDQSAIRVGDQGVNYFLNLSPLCRNVDPPTKRFHGELHLPVIPPLTFPRLNTMMGAADQIPNVWKAVT